jgi:MSHA pilin protein MshA
VGASINTAKDLARARWLANGSATATSITLDGTSPVTISIASGYPTADEAGIGAAITLPTGVAQNTGTGVFVYTGFSSCTVTYAAAGTVTVGASAANCR